MFLKFDQATSSAAQTSSSSLLYNKPQCGDTLSSCLSYGWQAFGFRFQFGALIHGC